METLERVKAIHGAVDEASGVLLMDAPYDADRVNMLREMGFTGAENVIDYNDHAVNGSYAKYYREKYPLYKFITRHQLEKIRTKFGLVEGELSRFKGNIPEKNIKEMMAFTIDAGDVAEPESSLMDRWAMETMEEINRAFQTSPVIMGRSSGKSDKRRDGISFAEMYFNSHKPIVSMSRAEEERNNARFRDDFYERTDRQRFDNLKRSFSEINKNQPRACMITADKELFTVPDRDLDPIVTVAVKGGYLIVTAWGAEANDPDVANEKMN